MLFHPYVRFFLIYLALTFNLSTVSAFAQTASGLYKPSLRIIRGVPVSPRNSSVVQVLYNDGQGSFLCTGTLITKEVVLTARHCVTRVVSRMSVLVGGTSLRSVSRVRIHPNVREDRKTGIIYHDLALVYLRRPVSSPTVSILSSRQIQPGEPFTIIGYGLTEYGRTGRLRSGVMNLDSADAEFIFARYDGTLSNTCEGDSGGPALASYVDGDGSVRTGLVGVTSGGMRQDCGPDDLSYFTNLQTSSSLSFLRRNVKNLKEE